MSDKVTPELAKIFARRRQIEEAANAGVFESSPDAIPTDFQSASACETTDAGVAESTPEAIHADLTSTDDNRDAAEVKRWPTQTGVFENSPDATNADFKNVAGEREEADVSDRVS